MKRDMVSLQKEDKEWKYQKKSIGYFKFSQVDRSGRAEAVVAQGSKLVLYS